MANNIVPSDFWGVRTPAWLDEDDLLSFTQNDTGAVSISEDDTHVHVDVALPGIDPEEVEITYDRGMLWIRGETSNEEDNKKRKYYRRAAQVFSYRITVPGDIDLQAEPEATCENGMLMLTFPKAASAKPKKIAVKKGQTNKNGKK